MAVVVAVLNLVGQWMASISKTPYGMFRVLWREEGKKRQKNFKTRAEAKKFAATLELTPAAKRSSVTVAQLLDDYRQRVTPTKRGARAEHFRIGRLMTRPFATLTLDRITAKDLQEFADARLQEPSNKYNKSLSPTTLTRELMTLSVVFNDAIRRGLMTKNPCADVRKPKPEPNRERTATDADLEKLMLASGWDGQSVPVSEIQLVMALFMFSCRTGMRSGEILRIEETWIDGNVIHLPREATKTDSRRDVALGKEARRLLALILERGDRPLICGRMSDQTRDVLWRRIRDRAGLGPVLDSAGRVIREGLNFHDGRATFCTWAASPDPRTGAPRLDVLALARQTGHKNLKMLQRYYRATAGEIAERLD